jgi:hypothetical protein
VLQAREYSFPKCLRLGDFVSGPWILVHSLVVEIPLRVVDVFGY